MSSKEAKIPKVSEVPTGLDVLLVVRRKKTTVFLSEKETTKIKDVKKDLEGIIGNPADDIRLLRGEKVMEDEKCLWDYEIQGKKPSVQDVEQDPWELGMVFKDEDGKWEKLSITKLRTDITPPKPPRPAAAPQEAQAAAPMEH